MMTSWDRKFLDLCDHIATWSKDRSTKVGAVIVNDRNKVISIGYNGFPIGFDDSVKERHGRPQKYDYTEHAERNAIYSAAELGVSVRGCTMYLSWFPCVDCARAIIQSGISRVVFKDSHSEDEKWIQSFKQGFDMLSECGVTLQKV